MQDPSGGHTQEPLHTSEVVEIIQRSKKGDETRIVDIIEQKIIQLSRRGKGRRSQIKILKAALIHPNAKIEVEISKRENEGNFLLQEFRGYAEAALLKEKLLLNLLKSPSFLRDSESAGIIDEYRGNKRNGKYKKNGLQKAYSKFCDS
ncbi:MAG: hypothetical protein ACD_58C00218G0002 [uncultured bacterium]|nr:MAG: hypothetical protein ACD_58C00218G0002 [uncultured bacterium]